MKKNLMSTLTLLSFFVLICSCSKDDLGVSEKPTALDDGIVESRSDCNCTFNIYNIIPSNAAPYTWGVDLYVNGTHIWGNNYVTGTSFITSPGSTIEVTFDALPGVIGDPCGWAEGGYTGGLTVQTRITCNGKTNNRTFSAPYCVETHSSQVYETNNKCWPIIP